MIFSVYYKFFREFSAFMSRLRRLFAAAMIDRTVPSVCRYLLGRGEDVTVVVETTDSILEFFSCWFRTLEAHQHHHPGGSLVLVFPHELPPSLAGTESRTYLLSVSVCRHGSRTTVIVGVVRDCVIAEWYYRRGTFH